MLSHLNSMPQFCQTRPIKSEMKDEAQQESPLVWVKPTIDFIQM